MGSSGGAFLVPANLPASLVNAIRPESYGNATGSDGTSAVQAAINAAAATAEANVGICDVLLTPGSVYNLGLLNVLSGVRIWAYGALINPILAEINQGLLFWAGVGSLSRFAVVGGTWAGVGTEGSGANTQALFYVGSNRGCSDVLFRDMTVTNWGSCVYYMRNPLRARVLDNTLQNVGAANPALLNAINFVVDNSFAQGQDMIARGNIVEGSQAAAIAYVNINNTGPTDVRFTAEGNICGGLAGGNNITGGINVELDGPAPATFNKFVIRGNHVNCNRAAGQALAVNLGQGTGTGNIGQAIVEGNVLVATGAGVGIQCEAATSDVIVTGNRITAPTPIGGTPYATGNRFSTGPCSGRAVLAAGTVTVNTTEVQANDNILLTPVVSGGAPGAVRVSAIVPGVSFTITSTSGTDTSTVYWRIDH